MMRICLLEVFLLKKYDSNLRRSGVMSVLAAYVIVSIILTFVLFLPNEQERRPPPYFMEQIVVNPSSLLVFLIVSILIASFLLVYLYFKSNKTELKDSV